MRVPRIPLPRLSAPGAPDTRWWYWVAAVPVLVAVWATAAAWLTVVVAAEFGGGAGDPVTVSVGFASLLVAIPLGVTLLVLPVALYRDAAAVDAVSEVRPGPRVWGVAGAAGLLGGAVGFALAGPGAAVPGGALGGVPVAGYYLLVRHRAVGVP